MLLYRRAISRTARAACALERATRDLTAEDIKMHPRWSASIFCKRRGSRSSAPIPSSHFGARAGGACANVLVVAASRRGNELRQDGRARMFHELRRSAPCLDGLVHAPQRLRASAGAAHAPGDCCRGLESAARNYVQMDVLECSTSCRGVHHHLMDRSMRLNDCAQALVRRMCQVIVVAASKARQGTTSRWTC